MHKDEQLDDEPGCLPSCLSPYSVPLLNTYSGSGTVIVAREHVEEQQMNHLGGLVFSW